MTIRLKNAVAISGVKKAQGQILNLTAAEEYWYVSTGQAEYMVPPDNVRAAYAITTRLDADYNVLGFNAGPSGSEYLAWDDLRFPAQGINPAGQTAPPTVDTSTYPGTLLFSNSTVNAIAGVAQMPHAWYRGSNIRPHLHWAKTTSASGGVVWEFSYAVCNVGDTMPAMSDWAAATSTTGDEDTAELHTIDGFAEIDMEGKRESCMIVWQVRRNTGAAGDDYGASARLLEVDLYFQVAKFGTTTEYPSA